jgi:hypothetical protein
MKNAKITLSQKYKIDADVNYSFYQLQSITSRKQMEKWRLQFDANTRQQSNVRSRAHGNTHLVLFFLTLHSIQNYQTQIYTSQYNIIHHIGCVELHCLNCTLVVNTKVSPDLFVYNL